MDRRLLFPAVVATAWAQQTSPASAEVEKAIRARVEQFYQLELDKKFRQAEDFVAEDSKDYFYNANKPNVRGFSVAAIELTDNDTRASVTVKIKSEMMFPGVGNQLLEIPAITKWKLEKGQWAWYHAPDEPIMTPFGKIRPGTGNQEGARVDIRGKIPDLATLQSQVSISRRTVVLTEGEPDQTVTISNAMSGPIGLDVSPAKIEGVSVELEKTQVNAGEAATLHFRLIGKSKASGVVRVACSPLGQAFDIQVTAN